MNINNVDEAYAVLGLRTGARAQEIIDAWTELTRLWDPNMHATGSRSYEQCVRMREATNAAYQMLISRTGIQQAPPAKETPQCAPVSIPVNPQANTQTIQHIVGGTPDEIFASAKQLESTNLQASIDAYKRLARVGHQKAQFRLGYLYLYGASKDPMQAAHWWKHAAIQGHIGAQFNLGLMYERGMGVEQDQNQAFYWYAQAASRGDLEANRKLQSLKTPAQQQTSNQAAVSQQELPKPVSPSGEQSVLGWAQVMRHRTGS